jgi:hypothetical protein
MAAPRAKGHESAPLNEHIACLDYSVAGKSGGKLCAYSHEAGASLDEKSFTRVDSRH